MIQEESIADKLPDDVEAEDTVVCAVTPICDKGVLP